MEASTEITLRTLHNVGFGTFQGNIVLNCAGSIENYLFSFLEILKSLLIS
jgi:hypothetical protein